MRRSSTVIGSIVLAGMSALAVTGASAQTWLRDYEIGGLAAVDTDGSVVLVGNRSASFAPGRQLVVARLAPSGEILNLRVMGFERDDREEDVRFLTDGAIAIGIRHRLEGGHLASPTDPNAAVVVLEPDLSLRWRRMMLSPSFEYEPRILPRADGGLILLADGDPDGDGNQDVWLVSFDAAGGVLWQRAYGTPGVTERPNAIEALPGGGFAVAGYVNDPDVPQADMFLARFDDSGTLLWARKYGVFVSGDNDRAFALAPAPDGSMVLAGHTDSFGGVANDWLVLKVDASGDVLWSARVDGARNALSTNDSLNAAVADAGGVILVGGRPKSPSETDPWAMRLDADGIWQWSRVWPGDDNVTGLAVEATPEGGWLISAQGTALGTGVGSLIRTDADGALGTACDPGNYNGVFPVVAAVDVATLDWTTTTPVVTASAEPWYENAESYGIAASCIGLPGEVSRPGAATPLHFTDATRLAWEPAMHSNADSFDLYRGALADLAAGDSPDCLDPGLSAPEAIDVTVPSPDEGFGYLVGARNAAGAGSLGAASDGSSRPNAFPCP